MTLKEFIILSSQAANREDLIRQMEKLSKPKYVCGKATPSDLNDISISQLLMLQSIKTDIELLTRPLGIIMGIDEADAMREDAARVIGFSYWVASEVERIGKLFKGTSIPPTEEEKQAGVEKLNFGAFGLIDWYAKRMGITDHAQVDDVPWIRVYKCLEMDAKRTIFERRLRQVYLNKTKAKKK